MHESASGTPHETRHTARAPWVLWAALAVSLSPALMELFRHWASEPWARESAVFVPLAVAGAMADRSPRRPRRLGWVLVAAGIAVALFGSAGGLPAIGRLAIPLAVVGMALGTGRPAARIALITLFVVPPPFSIVSVTSPGAERIAVQGSVEVARVLGADWVASGDTIAAAGGELRLSAPDMGIPLAHLLAGLGFCAGLASGAGALRSGLRGALWAVATLPAQLLALAAGLGLLAVAGANAARTFLDVAPPCVATAIAVAQFGRIAHATGARPHGGS